MEQPVRLGKAQNMRKYATFWKIYLGSYIKSALFCTKLWYSHCLVFLL